MNPAWIAAHEWHHSKFLQILVNAEWKKQHLSSASQTAGLSSQGNGTEIKYCLACGFFLLFAPKGKWILQNGFPQKIQSLQKLHLPTQKSYFSGELPASSEAQLFRGEPM